jgi:dephospho-CoA kinase
LLERDGATRVDRVLVVDCPEDVQVRRVASRSALSDAEVRAIMAVQPRAPNGWRADDVLDNAPGRCRQSRPRSRRSTSATR